MRWSLIAVVALTALLLASVASLVALGGGMRALTSGPLYAEMRLHDFAVPANFRVDRTELTEGLLRQIEARAASDVGLRMSLDAVGQKQLKDLIIPRLINPSVVARVIDDVGALNAILGIGDYRSAAEVTVVNASGRPLNDVVLMVPALVQVQDAAGTALDIVRRENVPDTVRLGGLAPSETRRLTVWMSQTPQQLLAAEASIRIGAADGLDGSLYLFGHSGWLGQDLETVPWTRWVVSFVALFSGALAAAGLLLLGVPALRGRTGIAVPVHP